VLQRDNSPTRASQVVLAQKC